MSPDLGSSDQDSIRRHQPRQPCFRSYCPSAEQVLGKKSDRHWGKGICITSNVLEVVRIPFPAQVHGLVVCGTSHSFTLESMPPVTSILPFGENATAVVSPAGLNDVR